MFEMSGIIPNDCAYTRISRDPHSFAAHLHCSFKVPPTLSQSLLRRSTTLPNRQRTKPTLGLRLCIFDRKGHLLIHISVCSLAAVASVSANGILTMIAVSWLCAGHSRVRPQIATRITTDEYVRRDLNHPLRPLG